MRLRSPRMGIRCSPPDGGGRCAAGARPCGAGCFCCSTQARTSLFITRPRGPDPCSAPRSTPISFAIRRVTGVARTRSRCSPLPPRGGGADATACGARLCAGPGAVESGAGSPAAREGRDGASCAVGGRAAEAGATCASAPAPPSTSSTTSVAWTLATSPSFPTVSTTFPRRGLGMTTVALSVMTSRSGWSSAIWSPGLTSHFTISPSTTPSPMSGSLNSHRAMRSSGACGLLPPKAGRALWPPIAQLVEPLLDAWGQRQVIVLERVGEGGVPAGDAQDGRLEMIEAALLHERGDLRAETARARPLVHDGAASRLPHALRDGFQIEGPQGAQIDELGVELGRLRAGGFRLVQHGAVGEDR